MKLFISLLCLSLSILPLFATSRTTATPIEKKTDTLHVAQASLIGSFPLQQPFSTDSTNLSGQSFDGSEILKYNENLIYTPTTEGSRILHRGEPLDSNTLNVLRLTIDTREWKKVQLQAERIGQHNTFLNGKKLTDNTLRLIPGRNTLAFLVYAARQARDTFDISLIGDSLSPLVLNNKEKPLFSWADMLHGKSFYQVKLSPTGRYLLTYYKTIRHDGEAQYSTVLTDLHKQKTLMRAEEYQNYSWLPHRDQLYFLHHTDRGEQLIMLDPSTLQTTPLAFHLPDGQLTIAPNTRFAIVEREEKGTESKGTLNQLKAPDDRLPGWRNRTALYFTDFATGVTRRLTFGKESVNLCAISPDNKRLLLSHHHHDLTQQPFDHTDLFEMHLSDGRIDTLLVKQPWLDHFSYSPDGRQLLIQGTASAFNGIGSALPHGQFAQGYDKRLYLFDLTTRKVTPLLKDFSPSVGHAKWNPGDSYIYMRCTDGYDETLWKLDPRTGKRQRFELPVTVVQGYSISETTTPRIAFFGQTATTSRNGYLAELDKRRPTCKPFGEISSAKAFGNVRMPSCHPWSFQRNEKDSIAGFYFLPADFDDRQKYPLIVYYYGGCVPTTRELEFQYPLSALANMGYVVLALEPSGTIGFGEKFAARHINTWGKGSAEDIIDATQAFCASHPYTDTKRIGCMGASYGGFMTEYLQTRTRLFAAAISHAGISNIASYWGGGYWGHTYGEVAQYGSYPWNNPDLYVKQSALFNADKIHTPLLLLHGTADTNVPTNESQQLFTALRILNRPVSYIQINGANHIVTDYHQRLEWQQAIMAWFAKYLQGNGNWWKDLGFD